MDRALVDTDRLGRLSGEVERISEALSAAGKRPDVAEGSAGADLSASAHRERRLRQVTVAGVNCGLVEAMYEARCDAADTEFCVDVEPTLGELKPGSRRLLVTASTHSTEKQLHLSLAVCGIVGCSRPHRAAVARAA
ncbi:hypothetical protein [Streptomyces sp. NPDC002265]|uniref:hypothetical protein n=1 Tax=Streptomyces sp. NPDC002265 TaxID=3154415 RepID=UPI00331BDDEE